MSVSSANHRLAGRRLDSLPGLFSPVAQSALMLRLAAQVEDYQGRPTLESGLPFRLWQFTEVLGLELVGLCESLSLASVQLGSGRG